MAVVRYLWPCSTTLTMHIQDHVSWHAKADFWSFDVEVSFECMGFSDVKPRVY